MRFLALEREVADAPWPAGDDLTTLLAAEAREAWLLRQAGVLREAWFRTDRNDAVLFLECADEAEAAAAMASLPLAQAGLITFEVMGLRPYDGWARLFGEA